MMLDHPLTPLAPPRRYWVLPVTFVLMVLLFGKLNSFDDDLPVNAELRPLPFVDGVVAFELAWDPGTAQGIMDDWFRNDAGLQTARASLYLDFLFIPTYVATLSMFCLWSASRCASMQCLRLAQTGTLLAWGACLAGLLDAIENAALLWQLSHGASMPWAQVAWAMASLKFIIVLGGGAGYALVFAGYFTFRKLWPPNSSLPSVAARSLC